MSSCWTASRKSTRPRSSEFHCGTIAPASTGRSTSSATYTVAADELEELLRLLGYETVAVASDQPTRRWADVRASRAAAKRSSSAIWSIVGQEFSIRCGLFGTWFEAAAALCVPGNHDMKFMKKLRGKDVQITHGLAQSLAEIEALPEDIREPFSQIAGRVSRWPGEPLSSRRRQARRRPCRDEGKRCRGAGRARFAILPCMAKRPAKPTNSACRCGTTGRPNIAARRWSSTATRRFPDPEWLNHTVNIDTGCVFGGKLTALRYPETRIRFGSGEADLLRTEPGRFCQPNTQRRRYRPSSFTTTCSTPTT